MTDLPLSLGNANDSLLCAQANASTMISFRREVLYDYPKRDCAVRSCSSGLPVVAANLPGAAHERRPAGPARLWTNATLTPVERPAALGDKLVLSEAEATAMERQMAQRMEAANAPSDPHEVQRAGQAVGGYNMFWADFGTQVAIVNGEHRSSLIVDPPQGRVPTLRPQAEKLVSAAERRGYDGPEQRPLGERCLLAFGNASGPPMLPVMYNSNYQIVQTADTVMILVEMPHDVRLIHLNGKPLPAGLRKWMGHSIGRWDGETLVVETAGLRKEQYISIGGGGSYRYVPSSENLKVIERFTRTGPRTILYEFTVEDPGDLHAVVARPGAAQRDRPAALRVRLPRRQLCVAGNSRRRARSGATGSQAGSALDAV